MRITEIVVHDPMKKRICVVYITSRLQPKEDNLSTTVYNNAKLCFGGRSWPVMPVENCQQVVLTA